MYVHTYVHMHVHTLPRPRRGPWFPNVAFVFLLGLAPLNSSRACLPWRDESISLELPTSFISPFSTPLIALLHTLGSQASDHGRGENYPAVQDAGQDSTVREKSCWVNWQTTEHPRLLHQAYTFLKQSTSFLFGYQVKSCSFRATFLTMPARVQTLHERAPTSAPANQANHFQETLQRHSHPQQRPPGTFRLAGEHRPENGKGPGLQDLAGKQPYQTCMDSTLGFPLHLLIS